MGTAIVFWLMQLCFCYVLWKIAKLVHFARAARQTGLPYTLTPVHELEVWAYLTNAILRYWYRKYTLNHGQGWPRWCQFMIKDWMYEDKYTTHARLGETFLVVSPEGIVCYTANASFGISIVTKRREFRKPAEKMKMLEPFGPNIVSVDGDLWKLHYKVTAPAVGDKINHEVWNDTKRQTSVVKEMWAQRGIVNLKTDIYSLGVNVMAYAGFGSQEVWPQDKHSDSEHRLSVVQCLCAIVEGLPSILLLPRWALSRFARAASDAHREFTLYTREMIAKERTSLKLQPNEKAVGKPGTLLSAMIEQNRQESKVSSLERTTLTDDEVLGNIFIFFMAGYDTTANTIIFSCVLMALYPDLQKLACDEVDSVGNASKEAGRSDLSYGEDFARFRYLLAFMYEVLRTFPIVLQMSRVVNESTDMAFPYDDGSANKFTLPQGCNVVVNITGLHYNENYWPEPATFQPKRWLSKEPNTFVPSSPTTDSDASASHEPRIPGHRKGTFMTFSEGSRSCLGKRFAAAEYVAFFSELLKDYEITLAPGVDRDEVENLYRRCSAGSPISLQPPANVEMRLVKRH